MQIRQSNLRYQNYILKCAIYLDRFNIIGIDSKRLLENGE